MSWGIIYIIFPAFEMIVLAEILIALGFALKGVSESPLLYSSLKKLGELSKFAKVESKGSALYFTIEAIASIASGYLFFINPNLPIIFATICFSIAAILAFYMKPIKIAKDETTTFKERFIETFNGFKFIFKSKRLHALLIFASVFYGVLGLANLYIKTFLNHIEISSKLFGYIFAIAAIASAIGSWVQGKIEKKHRNKTLTTISLVFISTFIIAGATSLIFKNYYILLTIGIIVFLIQSFIKGAYRIIIKEYVSRYTTSAIRSKLMSIYYLCENLGSATMLFIASRTIDLISIGTSYCLFGFILLIIMVLILNYMETRVGLNPEKYTKRDRFDLK